jgi:hypothetical protein
LPDVTHGQIRRKTALAISWLSRTLVRSIQLSQHERIRAAAETSPPRPGRRPNSHARQATESTLTQVPQNKRP